jgi:hypothetical protein
MENKWKIVIAGNNVKEGTYPNNGEIIKAIVRYFTGELCGEFILQEALKEVENNNKKLKEFKEKLIGKVEE